MNRPAQRPAGLLESLPSMISYPLRGAMPLMLLVLTFLRLLHHLPSLLGLVCAVLVMVLAMKFAVEALVNTAHGRYEPLAANELAATDGEAFRQLALQMLGLAALLAAAYFGGLAGLLAMAAVVVLFMPASMILLAMNGSLLNALNPLAVLGLIGRLGGAYFAVVAVMTALTMVTAVLENLLEYLLPSVLGEIPAGFIGFYSLVLVFHMLGDLIHRHHARLGLDVTPAIPRATYGNPAEDEAMEAAGRAAGEGRLDDSIALLGELFRGRGASDAVHDRWREYVIAQGDIARLAAHDRDYVVSLLVTGNPRRALAVFTDTAARDPQFRIDHDEAVAGLVHAANAAGQARKAVQLAEGFEQRFPDSPLLPEVILAVAWTQADQLEQVDAALRRVQLAMRVERDGPRADALQTLMARIDRLPRFA